MEYFDSGSVIWEIESTDKFDAIRELILKAPVFARIAGFDLAEFSNAVIAREKLQSTGLGHGVAIAHGRSDKIDCPRVALGISREGIHFDSADGKPVRLLFIVANHPSQHVDYLHILSSLVSMVRDKPFRRELLGCRDLMELQQKLCSSFRMQLERSRLRQAV